MTYFSNRRKTASIIVHQHNWILSNNCKGWSEMCNMIEFAYNLMLNLKSKMHYQPEFPYKYEESTLVKFTPKSYMRTTVGISLGPRKPGSGTEAASPADWVAWAQGHPHCCLRGLGVSVLTITWPSPLQSLHLPISSFRFRSKVSVSDCSWALGEVGITKL